MKFSLTLLPALLLLNVNIAAQSTNPTSQKEMQEKLKEVQKEIDKLTPEQKKMMEQMGIQLPTASSNSVLNSKNTSAVTNSMEKEFGLVPQKDLARINSISKTLLTNTTLPTFIKSVIQQVSAKLEASHKATATLMYKELKAKGYAPIAIGNTAASLWIIGHNQMALCLMGKALEEEPSNSENLNNYAAMLSLTGGEQLAIPILLKLNTDYPENYSILNNLGQAWYRLGELTKADKLFDSVLAIAPYHVQANMSKANIAENKGDPQKAIGLVRNAARNSLSADVHNRLRKLGYKLTMKDLTYPFKPDTDPLGLHQFKHPDFPKKASEEAILKTAWEDYHKDITEKSIQLMQQRNKLISISSREEIEKKQQQAIDALKGISSAETSNGLEMPFRARAQAALNILSADKSRKLHIDNSKKEIATLKKANEPILKEYKTKFDKLDREHALQMGEGEANKSFCTKFITLSEEYFKKMPNTQLEKSYNKSLAQLRRNIEEELFWKQFTLSTKEFELEVVNQQINWLSALAAVNYEGIGLGQKECLEITAATFGKLPDFDETHCQAHSILNLFFGSIEFNCTEMKTKLSIGNVELGMKQDMHKADFFDSYKSFTAEVSAGKSIKGPLGSKVGAEVKLGIEVGRNGVQDIWLGGEISGGFDCEVGGDKKSNNNPEGFKRSLKGKLAGEIHFTNDKGSISINSSGKIDAGSKVSFNDIKKVN